MVLQQDENKKNYVQLTDGESQEIDRISGLPRHKYIIARSFKTFQIVESRHQSSPGRGPTRLRAWVRNRDRLENRSHVVPKTEFQDGGDRTRIFTHKIIILA